ncbi:hypothetical protein Cgig2_000686 [Carnegiea gigantea]|uniref:Pentatricopeptide repeat-containing protein n=1 Tax=Carnegiea gigantea TaxID=171969 RepID=A0A9Q1KCG2_9CARY|nr:hypothetical protein Cgig2_000686 [Carnegiea gigantea]
MLMQGRTWSLSHIPETPCLSYCVESILEKCKTLDHVKQLQASLITLGHSQIQFFAFRLIRFCTLHLSNLQYARSIFEYTTSPNVYLYSAMINAYASEFDHLSVHTLYMNMLGRGRPCPNHFIYPHVLRSSSELRMLAEGGLPNQVTFACAFSAFGHTGMVQLGKEIHGYIYRRGLVLGSYISNALVDFYGKCGFLEQARCIFDYIQEKNLTLWNSMINCYALHGQSGSALDIFEEMVKADDKVKPDEITFIGLLNACTHGGLVERGYYYFDLMTKVYCVEPEIEHYGCIVDLLGRAGQFQEVIDIINGMKVEADEVIWGSLLNGCKIHGNVDLAEFAIRKLIEIDPNNGGYMSMLANLYVELAKWDKVRGVRKMLKEQNAQKIPGCSWIEVDWRLHQFHSADCTHPKADEICSVLESLFDLINRGLLGHACERDNDLTY